MSEWKCLSEGERELARERGLDPEDLMVNRVGKDYLVFLALRSRAETLVRLNEGSRRAAGKGA